MFLLWNAVYCLLILIASPWLLYSALRHGKYREGHLEKVLGLVPRRGGDRPCLWMHAVSVGEVNLLQPLLERWERSHPGWDCVISTTTKTGFDLARQKYVGRTVFYCPLDFSWAVRRALERIRPQMLVLAELELWPNLIRLAKRRNCHIAIVNGRLSERSYNGYRRLRPLFSAVFKDIDLVAAQNEEYADRFRRLGALDHRVHVTGSVKFDGVQTDRLNPRTAELRAVAGIETGDVIFLAGSTQSPEESLALATFQELYPRYPQLRLILVPRHLHRVGEIAAMLDASGLRWQRRTEWRTERQVPEARILLVDTIGELGAWWGAAQVAFVGGSMGRRGGQNMIEPAAFGAAVSFGPNTRNFRDVVALLRQHDAAVVVRNGQELTQFVQRCLDEPIWAASIGQRARALVAAQQGAADRMIELMGELASGQSRRRSAA